MSETPESGNNAEPPRPAKKRRKWPWIVGAIVVIAAIGGGIGGAAGGGSADADDTSGKPTTAQDQPRPAQTEKDEKPQVTYKITTSDGTAADVTWMNGGSQSQDNGAKTPWSKTVPVESFDMYSLTAQNKGSGKIACSVEKDGKVLKQAESSGQYAMVSCVASG
ncbi:MmpS family transport accessory protein [Sciscionella marina]|uniref:MmpS family transport accessory protein n=1 Tax=Sciscionella marina TaxID=508770 RepID=UPI000374819D|nr:MmpS family transport accessory protein [Sciscionella marina]